MDISIRLLLLLAFCCIPRCSFADDAKQQQLRSATVVGTVYFDTCFQHQFSKTGRFISGASVSVECGDDATKSSLFRRQVKTNRHGVFRIRLPPKVSRNIDNVKACSVKLNKSNEPFCAVASSTSSTGLRLKSKWNGVHVFSAGFFSFKPLKQPYLCYQEPKSKLLAEQKPAKPEFVFFPPSPLFPPPSLLPPVILHHHHRFFLRSSLHHHRHFSRQSSRHHHRHHHRHFCLRYRPSSAFVNSSTTVTGLTFPSIQVPVSSESSFPR